MKNLIRPDVWSVIQEGFDAAENRVHESLFSLGNGHVGGRGNHEERYSGDSLRGNYLAGVYYPDPTRVGWWKIGYPDYFAKVLNAADWKPIHITVAGEPLDLATAEIHEYRRELAMRVGELHRTFRATLPNGATVAVETVRFISMVRTTVGAVRYTLTVLAGPTGAGVPLEIGINSHVDGDVVNEDSNYEDGFWDEVTQEVDGSRSLVVSRTKKTGFVAGTACYTSVRVGGVDVAPEWSGSIRPRFAGSSTTVSVHVGEPVEVTKVAVNVTSRTMTADSDELVSAVVATSGADLEAAVGVGFGQLRAENAEAWEAKWATSDVAIDGDIAVQQGIRFNIFQLNSTFTGDDPDLNIGPKGFTGEKYGGVTYWDTEAFCLPFYLATAPPEVPRNLLRYRRRHLARAIENAAKLGFDGGAALYPMVTINGEECHNEWEITFEEVHRNGAIAFAIFDYVRFTGDREYLLDGGLDVLVAISRFWAQRVSWSEPRRCWVMLGVTGPNEYENNVDDNWYTNLIAQWTLRYTAEAIGVARQIDDGRTNTVLEALGVEEARELPRWREIAEGLHLPEDADRGVFLQQSNYLDKQLLTVDDLDPAERPINQHWSWDRILRSCFIKQADVLHGLWVLGDRFDLETVRRNFDFYERRTVHESSLSPSVHAVHAVRLGRLAKAHEMLLRSARLDLDDYNNDTGDGCHVTSMAGTWIAAVQGFGGLAVRADRLHLDPILAPGWTRLAFHVRFRGAVLAVELNEQSVHIHNGGAAECQLVCHGTEISLAPGDSLTIPSR